MNHAGAARRCVTHSTRLGLPFVFLLFATSVGCGTAGGPTADAGAPRDTVHAIPPARPASNPISGVSRWYAVQNVWLGKNKAYAQPFTSDPNAWIDLGFDLDGLITNSDDSACATSIAPPTWCPNPPPVRICQRVSGAVTKVLADGADGRDNNFGSQIMPIISTVDQTIEDDANSDIAAGHVTLLIRLDDFGGDDDAHVPGAVYVAGPLGVRPLFDGTDRWPALSTTLVDGSDLSRPKMSFPEGYTAGGIWVSGGLRSVEGSIVISVRGAPIEMPLDQMMVSFRVTDGTMGTIAGATAVASWQKAVGGWLPHFGICPGKAAYDAVVKVLSQAADLSFRAPGLQDPTQVCDAISVGIGFIAAPAGPPSGVVAASTQVPPSCSSM